nr:glycosyltransferase family A protein [Microbacterium sp. UBA837]
MTSFPPRFTALDQTPRVSVVVRTRDRPRYLRRALKSITAQTMARWECIIVNDGGDPTEINELVSSLHTELKDRVVVIHHAESRGRWKSANAGVLVSRAEYLVLHDDDDAWDPKFLASACTYLDENPGRDGVVSRTEIRWERRIGDAFETVQSEIFQPQLQDLLLSDALLFNRYVPIGFVYRRRLHEELGLYDESLPVVGDWAFNLRVLQRGPVEFLGEEPLAFWHQRADSDGPEGNSVIGSRDTHARYDALIRDSALREYVNENGLGLALYLTKFIDSRLVDVENGVRAEVANAPLWRVVRSKLRRLSAHLRR